MESDAEIVKILSDFLKGKSGPSDLALARLSFEGEDPFLGFDLPPLSATFDDFSREYQAVAKAMKECSLDDCLIALGAMLTLPELQSNAYRLEVLVHLACISARGKRRPTKAQVVAWFNQLDNGTCGRQEDPAEDVFLSVVTFGGQTYRLFEGCAEANSFHTQLFLNLLISMPDHGVYMNLKNTVLSLLVLSDELVERTGIPIYAVGQTVPRSEIPKPDDNIWAELRKRARVTDDELDGLGIDVALLEPFVSQDKDFAGLTSSTPGNSTLYAKPIRQLKTGLCVFLPASIGTAIRALIISTCSSVGQLSSLHKSLANAYAANLSEDSLLGRRGTSFQMRKFDGFYAGNAVAHVDAGRYLHLLLFVDGFEDHDQGWFTGVNPVKKISAYVAEAVTHTQGIISKKDGFKEGLTLVIGGGWGRALGVGVNDPPSDWRVESVPAHDVVTLSQTPNFKTLDLWRMLDARDQLQDLGITITNPSGLLNLFAWIRNNDGHIVPHEKMGDSFVGDENGGYLGIPVNASLRLRQAAYNAADIRALPRPDGSLARLRRAHGTPQYGFRELSPYYIDTDALGLRIYRAIYAGNRGTYWIEANTEEDLDVTLRYHLGNMTTHWAEQVFRYLDDMEGVNDSLQVYCRFQFRDHRLPHSDDPAVTDDEIHSMVEVLADTDGTFDCIVSDRFLSASRRPDNLAERTIVKAMVAAFLARDDRSGGRSVEELVNAIVRNDRARHFHAFSVPQLRDFIRDDLTDRAQIIERMDDANTRLGLGWLCRDRADGDQINGVDDCKSYLRALVDTLIQRFKQKLSRFNKRALIEKLLRNHETVFSEMDLWKRTYGAVESVSEDRDLAVGAAVEQMGQLNAASMSSRIIIEAAVCESLDDGGLQAGQYDIGKMLACASLIHHMGGYSEAMVAGIMRPEIKIAPTGEVMMNHDFSLEIVQPFGEYYQGNTLRRASEKYAENFVNVVTEDTAGDDASVSQKMTEFGDAWFEEYGFTLEDVRGFLTVCDGLLVERRKAVFEETRSDFLSLLVDRSGLSLVVAAKVLARFTLSPRSEWNSSPEGFLSSAWFPWQFRRELSLVTRPVIQLDQAENGRLLIAPTMVISNVIKFVSDARTGSLDQRMFSKNGKMFKWVGKVNGSDGEAFNDKVAHHFQTFGWAAQPNLSDGTILNRKKNPSFGDVDVLAWDPKQKRVLVIECKDLSFDKTLGEIARRLGKYRGTTSADGKRDDLRKHLDRCEDIEKNLGALSAFVGFEIEHVDRVLMFSQSTPIQFSKITEQFAVKVSTYEDAEADFLAAKGAELAGDAARGGG